MRELIRRCMVSLTGVCNLKTGLGHPADEASAKELFKALKAEGANLDAEVVRQFALELGWPPKHADTLAELAAKIGRGARVVIKHPRNWGKPTVEKHKADILDGGT